MHRERPLACDLTAEAIPLLASGIRVPGPVTNHLDTCLRCQAELARYRRTARDLRSLRSDALEPPDGGMLSTIEALHAVPGPRGAHVSGGMVATAAGAAAGVAGMLVWRTRRRALAV